MKHKLRRIHFVGMAVRDERYRRGAVNLGFESAARTSRKMPHQRLASWREDHGEARRATSKAQMRWWFLPR